MAKIWIDQLPFEVHDGQNLLQACLRLGFNLPYFCWHPAMGSVGACRQCAVKLFKDENDTRGKIVVACMTPASQGTRLSIEDPEARDFRASVIEWLMVSHPHDCPVCDEGSECHLQDMTVMTGHNYRRFRGKKRTFQNQYLGPFVNHEMNRCIQCYRCVRFYRDFAGGRDLDAFRLRDHVYFGRYTDGVLESEFSGNLVEVCPTGVFDDKTLMQHYTRKWDLQTAPSICVNCGLGCNTIPGERYGMLRRIRNRYNGDVNGYFLCDRGRYGYEFVNSDRRIRHPVMTEPGGPVSGQAALEYVGRLLSGGAKAIGIGSPRASLEANFALRSLVGPERFYIGLAEKDAQLMDTVVHIMQKSPVRQASQQDVAQADAVLVLGEDVSNTAPMLALALRQSIRQKPMKAAGALHIAEWDDASVRELVQKQKGPLFLATPAGTRLDDIATRTYQAAPANLARLGFAVAHHLDPNAPEVKGLPDDLNSLAADIARELKDAERPLIISGMSSGNLAVMQAADSIARALFASGHLAKLSFVVPECNSLGLALMGGGSLDQALAEFQSGQADTVIILENDLYRRGDPVLIDALFPAANHVVVLDSLQNATTARADVLLPAATFAEADGTLVNSEGRAQRFYQVFVPGDEIMESWRWLRDIMIAAGREEALAWQNLDAIASAMARAIPILQPTLQIAPPASYRIAGQKIPRQPARYSGRTAMVANISVHEPKPTDDPDSPLAFSMEGSNSLPPSPLIPRFWAPGWNSIQSLNKFQSEVGGPLIGGNPGCRLVEPSRNEENTYFQDIPPAFEPRKDEWLVVPLYHIYGSEEQSMLTPGIAMQAPQPYLGVNSADAARLHLKEGEQAEIQAGGVSYSLPIRQVPGLPEGVAGLPMGLAGLPAAGLPGQYGRIAAIPGEGGAKPQ
jgi:NADH-quinone oxidoreductase subunit G